MPISDWEDLCPQTIAWEAKTDRDDYGKATYAAPQTFRGRRVFKFSRVPGRNPGSEVLSSSQIWILGLPAVGYEDHVYVSGDSTPYPPILSVQRFPDENGDFFVKVFMGAAM